MSKEEILKNIFELSQADIIDIGEVIRGYTATVNKSKKDNKLIRCLFVKGYHNTNEFYKEHNITKDHSVTTAIFDGSNNLKAYLQLKKWLNIDDTTFLKILEGVQV